MKALAKLVGYPLITATVALILSMLVWGLFSLVSASVQVFRPDLDSEKAFVTGMVIIAGLAAAYAVPAMLHSLWEDIGQGSSDWHLEGIQLGENLWAYQYDEFDIPASQSID